MVSLLCFCTLLCEIVSIEDDEFELLLCDIKVLKHGSQSWSTILRFFVFEVFVTAISDNVKNCTKSVAGTAI